MRSTHFLAINIFILLTLTHHSLPQATEGSSSNENLKKASPDEDTSLIELKPDIGDRSISNGPDTSEDEDRLWIDFEKTMKRMMERMSKMMKNMPGMSTGFPEFPKTFPEMPKGFPEMPDLPRFPEDFDESWKEWMKEVEKGNGGEGTKVITRKSSVKSIQCINNNCTVCNDDKCVSGKYTNVMQQGDCKDAVCVAGCKGFVMQKDDGGDQCPICRCDGFGLREPCDKDEDCSNQKCNSKYKACEYPEPTQG